LPYRQDGAKNYYSSISNKPRTNDKLIDSLVFMCYYGLRLCEFEQKVPTSFVVNVALTQLSLDALFEFLDLTDPEIIVDVIQNFVRFIMS